MEEQRRCLWTTIVMQREEATLTATAAAKGVTTATAETDVATISMTHADFVTFTSTALVMSTSSTRKYKYSWEIPKRKLILNSYSSM